MSDFQNSIRKINQAIRYLENDAKTVMGVEAVNHFKDSFQNQGFTDKRLEKWPEVERRKPSSRWKGFQYGSTVPRPGQKTRKQGAVTNYSPAAETRPILSGTTQELMNGIKWQRTATGVKIYASTAYAKLINEGGSMKIFGRTSATMKKRQFMGKSEVLMTRIRTIILNDLKRILK